MWWWRLIVFAESAPPSPHFVSAYHLKIPTRIISKYLQYACWPRDLPGKFLYCVFQFLQQNTIIITYFFHIFGFLLIFQFCSFCLLSKFGNMVIQLKCYLMGSINGPEKIVRRIVFHFFNKIQDG